MSKKGNIPGILSLLKIFFLNYCQQQQKKSFHMGEIVPLATDQTINLVWNSLKKDCSSTQNIFHTECIQKTRTRTGQTRLMLPWASFSSRSTAFSNSSSSSLLGSSFLDPFPSKEIPRTQIHQVTPMNTQQILWPFRSQPIFIPWIRLDRIIKSDIKNAWTQEGWYQCDPHQTKMTSNSCFTESLAVVFSFLNETDI